MAKDKVTPLIAVILILSTTGLAAYGQTESGSSATVEVIPAENRSDTRIIATTDKDTGPSSDGWLRGDVSTYILALLTLVAAALTYKNRKQ